MEYFNISVRFTSFRVSETEGPAVKVYDGRLRHAHRMKKSEFHNFLHKALRWIIIRYFLVSISRPLQLRLALLELILYIKNWYLYCILNNKK